MFRDKVVIITGGSSGLGLELAHRLAEEGARLVLVARDRQRLEQAAQEVCARHRGARVAVESLDVRDEAAAHACMQRIAEAHGGIDVLINSAGILREGRFDQLPMAVFREIMDVNWYGLMIATRAALPWLRRSRGRVVNIASVAGLAGVYGYSAYCSSKHALVGLTESLRYELEPEGIRVHLVCPGEFDSAMVDELERHRSPENRAHALTIPKVSAGAVADGVLAGMRAGRFLIVPGTTTRLTAFGIRHFPSLVRALGDRTVRRARRAKRDP